ncbi:MAG: peptidoglycan-binding protein [Candidatus Wildermuthbacteria bacterium]|nr:peptidoglycan-binding protein [Candidatus Wildermuthbacteria bacterium]
MFTFQQAKDWIKQLQRQYGELKEGKRFPTFAQWKKFPSVLSKKERILFSLFLALSVASFTFLLGRLYIASTREIPVQGGSFTEGIVGFPRYINPLYADAYDADRDLVQLVYSGLLTYDNAGKLVPDLAKDFTVEEGGKVIEFNLREEAVWHDGKPFTADDVIFTVETVQNPKYKSPIRTNWIGVRAEKITNDRVRFELKEPYAPFLERLTLKILPSHIWKSVAPENFALSMYNLEPVGTGPYRVSGISQERTGAIKEIRLRGFKEYYGKKPYIQSIAFRFFPDEKELIAAANQGLLDVFSIHSVQDIQRVKTDGLNVYSFSLPRYFAIFFNLNSLNDQDIVKSRDMRQALADSIDKEALTSAILKNHGRIVSSPALPGIFKLAEPALLQTKNTERAERILLSKGYKKENGMWFPPAKKSGDGIQSTLVQGNKSADVKKLQECLAKDAELYPSGKISGTFDAATKEAVIRFQEKYADDILAPQGLNKGTGKVAGATREKLNMLCFTSRENLPLSVSIATVNQPPLLDIAEAIAGQWKDFGIQAEVQAYSPSDLEHDVIKPRNFQMLLFGEILGKIPDLFPFWHSSQKRDPGLNLSGYENKKADALLESARKELDEEARNKKLEEFQNVLLQDIPAIFLYDTHYVYIAADDIRGITEQIIADPSQRFSGIADWYIRTGRVWKNPNAKAQMPNEIQSPNVK